MPLHFFCNTAPSGLKGGELQLQISQQVSSVADLHSGMAQDIFRQRFSSKLHYIKKVHKLVLMSYECACYEL